MSAARFFFNYFTTSTMIVLAAVCSMAAFPPQEWPRALGMFIGILLIYTSGYAHGRANALGK